MPEDLVSLIAKHTDPQFISKWFDSAIHAYARDNCRLPQKPERLNSPTRGAAIRERGIEVLFDQLLGDMDGGDDQRLSGPHHADPRRAEPHSLSGDGVHFFTQANPARPSGKKLEDAGMARQFIDIEARIDRLGWPPSTSTWPAAKRF